MYYTVLDEALDKVFTGAWMEVHTWLEIKKYSEIYYVFCHQTKEFMTGMEFYTQGTD